MQDSICLNGEKYSTLTEAAEKHGLALSTLSRRINRWGTHDDRIFKEPDNRGKGRYIIIDGVKYNSVKEASNATNMQYRDLYACVAKFPKKQKFTTDEIKKILAVKGKIKIYDRYFENMDEAAKFYGMSKNTLLGRIKRFGKEDRRITDPVQTQKKGRPLRIKDKVYPSIYSAAKANGISISKLENRVAYYGRDISKWPKHVYDNLFTK